MFRKTVSTAALVALVAFSLVSAQTYTDCNPRKKTCPPDPALGTSVKCDFTQGKCDAFRPLDGTEIKYDNNGAVFTITNAHHAPTIETTKYIFFGRVEVELRCAAGPSIISAIVLQSHTLDEIDFEWVGSDAAHVQSNYFGKSDKMTYDRGGFHEVSNPASEFHKYAIEWTKDSIQWSVDGQIVRVLKYSDAKGGSQFPQTPMQVKLGTWSAKQEGTQTWAGGPPDFSRGPFVAHYRSVTIIDYAGGDKPADGKLKEYVYGDRSGNWESIRVIREKENNLQSNEKAGMKTGNDNGSHETLTPVPSNGAGPTSMASSPKPPTTDEGSSGDNPETTETGAIIGSVSSSTPWLTSSSPISSHSNGTAVTVPSHSSAIRFTSFLGNMASACVGALVAQHFL